MPTAASDGPSRHERRIRLGHYADRLYPYQAVAIVALSVVSYLVPGLAFLAWVFLLPLAVFTYAQMVWHRGLCEACMAETPLNGSELAEKYRRERALFHRFDHRRHGRLWLPLAWLLSLQLPWLFVPVPWKLPVVFVLSVPFFVIVSRHNRVYPWCRQCGWKDGGPEEPSPVVPPVPTGKVSV